MQRQAIVSALERLDKPGLVLITKRAVERVAPLNRDTTTGLEWGSVFFSDLADDSARSAARWQFVTETAQTADSASAMKCLESAARAAYWGGMAFTVDAAPDKENAVDSRAAFQRAIESDVVALGGGTKASELGGLWLDQPPIWAR